jgi:hypothetical protein
VTKLDAANSSTPISSVKCQGAPESGSRSRAPLWEFDRDRDHAGIEAGQKRDREIEPRRIGQHGALAGPGDAAQPAGHTARPRAEIGVGQMPGFVLTIAEKPVSDRAGLRHRPSVGHLQQIGGLDRHTVDGHPTPLTSPCAP